MLIARIATAVIFGIILHIHSSHLIARLVSVLAIVLNITISLLVIIWLFIGYVYLYFLTVNGTLFGLDICMHIIQEYIILRE